MSKRKTESTDTRESGGIRISDADRRAALIGGVPVRPRPTPEPYNPAATKARLKKVIAKGWWNAPWDREGFTIATSTEEARACSLAMRDHNVVSSDKLIDALLAGPPKGPYGDVPSDDVRTCVPVLSYRAAGLEELVRALTESESEDGGWTIGFERDVLPFLDASERSECASLLRPALATHSWNSVVPRALVALGETSDTVRRFVKALAAGSGRPQAIGGSYGQKANLVLQAVVCLGDAEEVARELRRLDALPCTPAEARAVMAASGARCLDLVAQSAQLSTNKAAAESMVRALALAEVPECAPAMLDLATRSNAKGVARAWLDERPDLAFAGLLPDILAGRPRAAAAIEYLRSLIKRGGADALDRALAEHPEQAARALRAKLGTVEESVPVAVEEELPDWVAQALLGRARPSTNVAKLTPGQLDERERVESTRGVVAEHDRASPLPAPEPRPPTEPFDLDAALVQIRTTGAWGYGPSARSIAMSRDEAVLRLLASDARFARPSAMTLEERVRRADPTDLGRVELMAAVVVPAFVVFGFEGLARTLESRYGRCAEVVVDSIVRYLSTTERDALREFLLARERMTVATFEVVCELGVPRDQLSALVGRIEHDDPHGYYVGDLLECIYRLRDPDEIVAEVTKRDVQLRHGAERWLERTGLAGVAILAEAAKAQRSPEMLRVLASVVSPKVARAMLGALGNAKLRPIAHEWIDAHPLVSIDAFAALVGTRDRLSSVAAKQLRRLCGRGFASHVEERARDNPKAAKAAFDPSAGKAKPNDTDRALAAVLPALPFETASGTRQLGPELVAQVVAELRASQLGDPSEAVETLREHAPVAVRDAFAWALFRTWIDESTPAKDRWKLDAIGLIGSDACAASLVPFIKEWPTTNQYQRALRGVDCMRAIGSDGAIREVHALAERVKRASLRQHASATLDLIAQDRGLTREELGDRIVPDGGLDAQGTRRLDFGARTFTVVVGRDLKPILRDAAGKKVATLPKPTGSDDPALASEAHAVWKVLKKNVADAAKTQTGRLELAMIVGRRWSRADFEMLFVRHPLMNRLAQRLVWWTHDAKGAPGRMFRIVDDGTYADVRDVAFVIPDDAVEIGLVHPMRGDAAESEPWGAVLADYDLVPAFAQFGRPVHRLLPEESTVGALTRWTAHDVDPKSLFFGLEAFGWFRGPVEDHGTFRRHTRQYGAITASVAYDPGGQGSGGLADRQRIVDLRFSTHDRARRQGDDVSLLPSQVDAVIVSEAIQDVTFVFERGAPK